MDKEVNITPPEEVIKCPKCGEYWFSETPTRFTIQQDGTKLYESLCNKGHVYKLEDNPYGVH